MILKSLIKTTIVVSSFVGIQAAQAALLTCPSSLTATGTSKVTWDNSTTTAVSSCQYIDPADNNNTASVSTVNAAGFFGTSNWAENAAKVEISGEGLSGSWAITGANFAAEDYMIVFKDGAGTNLIGFLFNETTSFGDWTTPFVSGLWGLDQTKGVSHYMIFERPGTLVPPGGGEAPEPGILALMGLGMAGFAAARRRSAKK